ncbi:hypothetical protein Pelo_18131 [Pelomyxa schiedti]|nr:hypothetical protein Pelo_18131 [Pelomyxa schiedti]
MDTKWRAGLAAPHQLWDAITNATQCAHRPLQGANHKWWLLYDNMDHSLTVVDLDRHQQAVWMGVDSVKVDNPERGTELSSPRVVGITFNKYAPDEALILFYESCWERYFLLLVIDVNKTFATQKASVFSVTKCLFSAREMREIFSWRSSSLLIMNKAHGGERVFICQAEAVDRNTSGTVFEVAEGVGTCRLISRKADDGSIEVWDCNNAAAGGKPLRVLRASFKISNLIPSPSP